MARNQHEKSLPGRVARGTSRAGVGGGALLIGFALYMLLRGFGSGGTGESGSGTGDSGPTMITTRSSSGSPDVTNSEDTQPIAAPETIEGGLTDDEKRALSGDVFSVLIDERDYLIELPGTSESIFRPSTLDRVVELACLAKGDTNGIKVRILRRESSRASAEFQLKTSLESKGIHRDAIMMPGDFVP